MYSLFNIDSKLAPPMLRLPEWNSIKDGYRRNLNTLLTYYRNNARAVNSDHLLVQILQSIGIPLSLNLERYFTNVERLALTLAGPFGLTSSINSGKVFDGIFYGKGNREILIVSDESFNVEKAHLNWQGLSPVRAIRHPFTDLSLNIADGKRKSVESGVSVISINITMLAIQYRAFVLSQRVTNSEAALNVMQFIYMYVLPNMLLTHLDQALFNRFDHLWQGLPVERTSGRHPVATIDYEKRVISFHMRLMQEHRAANYNFRDTLAMIPAVSSMTMSDAMRMPDVVPTRQVLWALVLARLNVLLFVIKTQKYGPRQTNQGEVDVIGSTLINLRRQHVFESVLPRELYDDTIADIDNIISLCNIPSPFRKVS
jgi:hypothetical protein